MKSIIVDIYIPFEQYQAHYAGTVKQVLAQARDGRTIRFPSEILRQFVSREGVEGSFQIEFDDDNRFKSIIRL